MLEIGSSKIDASSESHLLRPKRDRLPAAPRVAGGQAKQRVACLDACKTSPDLILRSFNTWAFKREQPDSVDLLLKSISKAVSHRQPIPFVLYWGKGPRRTEGAPDTLCLNFLNSLAERVRQVYSPGALFTLIFTDTHADLNGHSADASQQYFSEIAALGKAFEFRSCLLGDLVADSSLSDAESDAPGTPMLSKLSSCALKWYQGEEHPSAVARRYYEMNMTEKRAVEAAFPDAIFITFNGSDVREIFPENLPIFYMYSIKRGTSVKPWFLPDPVSTSQTTGEFATAE